MQAIVIDKPYTFIPPRPSRCWQWIIRRLLPRRLPVSITRDRAAETDPLTAAIRTQMEALLTSR